jgi:hypothetical protein
MRLSTVPLLVSIALLATQPLAGQSSRAQTAARGAPRASIPTILAADAHRPQRPRLRAVTDAGVLQARRDSLLGLLGLTRAQLSAPIRLTPAHSVVPFRGWLVFQGTTLVAGAQDAYAQPAYAVMRSTYPNAWEESGIWLHLEIEAGSKYLVECDIDQADEVFVSQDYHHHTFSFVPPSFIIQGGAANGHASAKIRANGLSSYPPIFYGCDVSKLP